MGRNRIGSGIRVCASFQIFALRLLLHYVGDHLLGDLGGGNIRGGGRVHGVNSFLSSLHLQCCT